MENLSLSNIVSYRHVNCRKHYSFEGLDTNFVIASKINDFVVYVYVLLTYTKKYDTTS